MDVPGGVLIPVLPRVLAWSVALVVLALVVPGCGSSDPLLLPNPAETQLALGTVTGGVLSGGIVQGAVNISTIPASDTTVTSATGSFTLAQITPGSYTLVAEKAGFQRAFASLEVRANRTSTVNLTIFPATGAGFIAGQVTDGAFGLELVKIDTTPVSQTVLTTADGRYQISGAPGRYEVRALRLGYSPETRVVQLLEGQTVTQDFALGPRSDGQLSGQVTDQTGAPLSSARVDLFFGSQAFTAFADLAGNYQFLNLTTGFYVLSAESSGFLPTSKGLEARGGTVANGDLVLYPLSQPVPVPGAITGTIADAQDLPVAGITVALSVAAVPASVVTLADGRFTFVDVPAGSVSVTATQAVAPPGGPVFGAGTRIVTVGAAQTADGSLNLEEI